MKIAFLFPGQGAQKVGMGRDLYDAFPSARAVFEEANDALGEDLSRLIFEGPNEELTLTANTQPAILTVSIAALRAFGEYSDIQPQFVAGHSLGEFSALVAAGAMSFQDAVRTTRDRGTFMQRAVSPGEGAMAAVMGSLSSDEITKACKKAAQQEVVSPANFNSPAQTVISGSVNAVERASDILSDLGAKVIPLKVSAPFHCELMEPAAKQLRETLKKVTFQDPRVPVITNVEAKPNSEAALISDILVRQVTSTVHWIDSIRYMYDAGIQTFFEFGPGNVLAGLLKRIERGAATVSVNSIAGLDKAKGALEKL
jgi:[acyl-carrier-protein] S-malonyltransferase